MDLDPYHMLVYLGADNKKAKAKKVEVKKVPGFGRKPSKRRRVNG